LRSLHAPDYRLFIDLLVARRIASGLTQRDVAKALRKAPSYIGRIETCERRLDIVELVDLCEAICISPRSVLDQFLKAKRASDRVTPAPMSADSKLTKKR
jgi:transcriptional regulator with XRE-family HTH domain